jgi:hypothetical protein
MKLDRDSDIRLEEHSNLNIEYQSRWTLARVESRPNFTLIFLYIYPTMAQLQHLKKLSGSILATHFLIICDREHLEEYHGENRFPVRPFSGRFTTYKNVVILL